MTSIFRLVNLLLFLAALPARAADEKSGGADPMAGWEPSVIKSADKDKKEITALLKAMEGAAAKGDLDAAVALMDFPVLMVTDDSQGDASAEPWSREQWVTMMKPFYSKPMPPGSMTSGKPAIFLVSDSLATVGFPWTMKMGGKSVSGTSATLVIKKGGAWKVKSSIEGGWGDAMAGGGAGGSDQGNTPGK